MKTSGFKEDELRKLATCAVCARKIGQTGIPLFYVLTMERHGVNLPAAGRQDALGRMIGSAMLATVMGPGEVMTIPVMDRIRFMVCEDCGCKPISVAELAESESVE